MVNPKSVMTDRSWQLIQVVKAAYPSMTTAEIIEMLLSNWVHQQAEYNPAAPIIAHDAHLDEPSTDLRDD